MMMIDNNGDDSSAPCKNAHKEGCLPATAWTKQCVHCAGFDFKVEVVQNLESDDNNVDQNDVGAAADHYMTWMIMMI